jgi:hypothetical protein
VATPLCGKKDIGEYKNCVIYMKELFLHFNYISSLYIVTKEIKYEKREKGGVESVACFVCSML